jgi:hypothetical protein
MYKATCKCHACGASFEVEFVLPPSDEDKEGFYCEDCAKKFQESMAPKEILTRAMELLSLDPDWVVNKPATVATKTLNILTAEYPKLKKHQAKDIIARAARKLRYAHTVQDHD